MSRRADRSTDPNPSTTPGLEPGGGVPPGETPPEADQMSFSKDTRAFTPNQSAAAGSRTPLVIALVVLGAFTALVVLGLIAQILTLH
jgi:hypothetical protein